MMFGFAARTSSTSIFSFALADGRKLTFSYTGLLVRIEGELRIRLEDESMSPKMLAAMNPQGN